MTNDNGLPAYEAGVKSRFLVIYHWPCADGFTAALIAKDALPEGEVQFLGAGHGDDPPDVSNIEVTYILDFSYPREVLEAMAKQTSLVVLDHHKTAEEALKGLPYCHFDMHRSGAMMAWDWFHPGEDGMDAPALVQYVQDRDLWRWALRDTRAISAFLKTVPLTVEAWTGAQEVLESSFDIAAVAGSAVLAFQAMVVADICEQAEYITFEGHKVPIVQCPGMLRSEVGNELIQGHAFSITVRPSEEGDRWSLRSTNDGEDVSAIAKKWGGGGHRNAAAFLMTAEKQAQFFVDDE